MNFAGGRFLRDGAKRDFPLPHFGRRGFVNPFRQKANLSLESGVQQGVYERRYLPPLVVLDAGQDQISLHFVKDYNASRR